MFSQSFIWSGNYWFLEVDKNPRPHSDLTCTGMTARKLIGDAMLGFVVILEARDLRSKSVGRAIELATYVGVPVMWALNV